MYFIMKKITGLFFVFAFFTSVLCAKSIEVTTSEMDVTIAGSLPYVVKMLNGQYY